MQHIGLNITNERGDSVSKSDINFAPVLETVWKVEASKEKYPFLNGIDPYGDTYFNLYQSPKVIGELENLKRENVTESVLKEINDTIDFLKKVEQGISAKFIGD